MKTLELVSKKWLSNCFEISENGQVIGSLKIRAFSEQGDLEVKGSSFTFRSKGIFERKFFLYRNEDILITATKTSAWTSDVALGIADRNVTLTKKSVFKRDFELMENNSSIGEISLEGWLNTKVRIQVKSEFPDPVLCFFFWIAYLIVQRQAAAAGVT